jgi:TP901 family phage tail tape measure protein
MESTAKLTIIVDSVNKASSEIASVSTEIRNLVAAAKEINIAMANSSEQIIRGLKKVYEQTAANTKQKTEEAQKAKAEAADRKAREDAEAERLRQAAEKAKQHAKEVAEAWTALRNVGLAFTAIGASIMAAATFPVAEAAKFEQALSNLRAVLEGTETDLGRLKEKAIDLASTTKFRTEEVAHAMTLLARAGMDTNQVLELTEPTLRLAIAGEMDFESATEITINALNSMHLSATDLNHVVDVLAHTAAATVTDVSDLAESFKYAAPLAYNMSMSIDELNAMLGVLSNAGIKAEMGGTAMRGMMIALEAPTEAAKLALRDLGVDVVRFSNGALDLISTLEALGKANMGVGHATDIFRRYSASAAIALSQMIPEVRKLTEENQRATGASREMADTMMKNLLGAIAELKASFNALIVTLGSGLLPLFTKLVKAIDLVVDGTQTLVDTYSGLGTVLDGLIFLIGGLFLALGSIATVSWSIHKVWGELLIVWGLLKDTAIGVAITEVASGFAHFATMAAKAAAESVILNAALGPAGLAAGIGIVALEVGGIIWAYRKWKDAEDEVLRNASALRHRSQQFVEQAGLEIKSIEEIRDLTEDQAILYAEGLRRKIAYWTDMRAAMVREGKDVTEVDEKLKESINTLGLVTHAWDRAKKSIRATTDEVEDFLKTCQKTYESARKEMEDWQNDIDKYNKDLRDMHLDTQDKLRVLDRKAMSDQAAWYDTQLHAEEKLSAAKKAYAEGDYKLAHDLLKAAENLYESLATEVTEKVEKITYEQTEKGMKSVKKQVDNVIISMDTGVNAASQGILKVQGVSALVFDAQRKDAKDMWDKYDKQAKDAEQAMAEVAAKRKAQVIIEVPFLEKWRERLDSLADPKTKVITIVEVEAPKKKGEGGPVGFARGGQLPGDSKIDSIPVLARPGEWFINNEAVKHWESLFGNGFMHAINNPWSKIGSTLEAVIKSNQGVQLSAGNLVKSAFPRYAAGGSVAGIQDLGRVEIVVGNKGFPVFGKINILDTLKGEIEKENLLRSN